MVSIHFKDLKQNLIQALEQAKQSVSVVAIFFSHEEIFDLLCRKINQGIAVEIIIPNNYFNNREDGLAWQKLIDAGGRIYCLPIEVPLQQHFCLLDAEILIGGSFSLSYPALNESKESHNLMILSHEYPAFLLFKEEFERLKTLATAAEQITPLLYEYAAIQDMYSLRNLLSEEYLVRANEESAKGNTSKALQLMNVSAELDAKNEALRLGYQHKVHQQIDDSEAIEWKKRGENELRSGNFEGAIEAFARMSSLQPDNAEAYLNIAVAKWKQGKFQEQAEYAMKAVKVDKNYVRAYNMLGLAYDALKNKEAALKSYSECIAISPDGYSYYWNRGLVYKSLAQMQNAGADFKKVIELCTNTLQNDPGNAAATKLREAARREINQIN